MTTRATGKFDVRLAPEPIIHGSETCSVSRMSIDKDFHGDLEAQSLGEMLAAHGHVEGSAAYVAMEEVTGTLGGREGSFVLQHRAIMNRGAPEQSVTVVPDSGTGDLVGLTGLMTIIIDAGAHSYEFDYDLDESA
jgi:hypothetical protein